MEKQMLILLIFTLTKNGGENVTSRSQTDLLIALLAVRPTICGEEILYATEEENVFHFGSESMGIPAGTECKWTIANKWKNEESKVSILVYLKPTSKSQPNQCVKFLSNMASTDQTICATNGRNVFESTEDYATMFFSRESNDAKLEHFSVYYKLGNLKNGKCGSALLTAKDTWQVLNVPTASNCSWLLSANTTESIVVYTKDQISEKQTQCVKVREASKEEFHQLCENTNNAIVMMTQPIRISRSSSNPMPNNEETFSIYYRVDNCGDFKLHVSEGEKTFDICSVPGDIPEDHKCGWQINADNGKPFEIKLKHSGIADHCIRVLCGRSETICANSWKNVVKCTEQAAYVYFPEEGLAHRMRNFQVIYGPVTSRSQTDLLIALLAVRPTICGEEILYATEEENVFHFGSESMGIPAGIECKWTIANKWKNEESKVSILVYLKPTSKSQPNQCVKFLSNMASTDQTICATNGRNVFESTEDYATMFFSRESNDAKLEHFSVYYKLGNLKNGKCGSALLTAKDTWQVLNVPTASNCSWLLSANTTESIVVYTKDQVTWIK
ncbi:hypothetical protein FGIG_11742 [Fasciola gigantica]|uniref:CUB domain-containing protein n=1 Tax=Fasciola gigantica TaxID=46835 RepID=A0A504Z139_FASGI|nr:hypothetical protein FGIG_11742 [Fasciola gigantica]